MHRYQFKQIDEMDEKANAPSTLVTAAPAIIGASLTAGAVTWVLRSGLLISAALSATPLWRPMDPVPILMDSEEEESWYEQDAKVSGESPINAGNDPDKKGTGNG